MISHDWESLSGLWGLLGFMGFMGFMGFIWFIGVYWGLWGLWGLWSLLGFMSMDREAIYTQKWLKINDLPQTRQSGLVFDMLAESVQKTVSIKIF
jgi:hypothetical protein